MKKLKKNNHIKNLKNHKKLDIIKIFWKKFKNHKKLAKKSSKNNTGTTENHHTNNQT